MTSPSHFLLSLFAKHEHFTNETHSIRRRFQILCLIYLNCASLLLLLSFSVIFKQTIQDAEVQLFAIGSLPFVFASLFLIRAQKLNLAAACIGIVFHLTNFIMSDLMLFPFVSLVALLVYPYFLLFVTSSLHVLTLNAVFCVGRFFFLSQQIYQIFSEIHNEEQVKQLYSLMITLFFLVCSISLISILQKSMEIFVWSSIEENLMKSVNQTKEATEAMEAKNRFISMISHEIRNPLNAIKGTIDYLGQILTDQNHLKILKNAKIGGEILLNLMNNVLDAAKLKSEKIEIFYNETFLLDVLKKVLVVNSELLKNKDLHTKVYLDENLPETFYMDGSRLLQILMNLISNAIKFTAKNGSISVYISSCSENSSKEKLLEPIFMESDKVIPVEKITPKKVFFASETFETEEDLSIAEEIDRRTKRPQTVSPSKLHFKRLQDVHRNSVFQGTPVADPWEIHRISFDNSPMKKKLDDGFLKIQISDTGCGISQDNIKKLFGMFEQVTDHPRSSAGGSGLGLWICKQLCQRMNGDIQVYSEVGRGSSFVFYLPINRLRVQNKNLIKEEENIKEEVSRKQVKALIVDENETNIYLHKFLLEKQGVKVVTGKNGKEAIETYKGQGNEGLSFILMDVDMPGMDGFLAAMKIREWEMKNKMKQCEIYFVTGEYFSEREVKRKYEKIGGNKQRIKFLRKPLGLDEIKDIVDGLKE